MGFCNSNARSAEQEQSLGKAMGVELSSVFSLKNGGFLADFGKIDRYFYKYCSRFFDIVEQSEWAVLSVFQSQEVASLIISCGFKRVVK